MKHRARGRGLMGLALSCALTCVLWIAQTNTVFLQTAAPQVGAADTFGAAGNNNGKPKGVWVAQGTGPTIDGQVEGIEDGEWWAPFTPWPRIRSFRACSSSGR